MTRILFFALLAAVVWIWFSKKKRKPELPEQKAAPERIERIVECARCGLRIPEGEALPADDQHFCCAEHRDAHVARH
jgi:uncharacterized protein